MVTLFALAQDPDTAILSSIPKSIIDLRIATHVFQLEHLGEEIGKLISTLNSRAFHSKYNK